MIKESMFYGEPKLKEYRDMDVPAIIKEHLLIRGTKSRDLKGHVQETNHDVPAKELVADGLFLYGLKANATNKQAIIYYCERWAQKNGYMEGNLIHVPDSLWNECDKKNEEFTNGNDRKERID